MKTIFDSNIWISFLIGHKLQTVHELLANPKVEIFYCQELVEEIINVTQKTVICFLWLKQLGPTISSAVIPTFLSLSDTKTHN